ncbi:bifunctional 3-(3-hydroxy-phenyl)propionate/3-hydroxycinnamic acid hydroxylase MhpA [Pseudomonas helleri]|uniref:bifunctional 3-(3-hydroxy-phenyl)propionate/3-hydroxycinnamic acid hydroxylase MhpA n=1 Tax=Pseudomonas helleri TaxID=1608996 RepID=UPI003802A6AA
MRDVVIIGCGPTGALLANLLGELGVSTLVLERTAGVLEIPRAVHIDGETMRIIQAAGMANEVLALSRPGHGMHWVDAEGETLVVREGQQGLGDQGWHNDYYFHQPDLEKAVRAGLARFPHVELREGMQVRDFRQDDAGVTLSVLNGQTCQIEQIQARYVVGCDGARSIVRQWIGDSHEDLGLHQAWLVVDVQLYRPLDLPEHTVQHCNPARPATSNYITPLRRRWEIMLLDSDDHTEITHPEKVWDLLAPWVRPSQGKLERAATYMFHSLVSQEWQKGRLFIAGDAAHQTPPFLGQGLCAAARDASNLSWKLAQAIAHPDSAGILNTYEPERKPHAREFVDLAVQLGGIIQETCPKAASVRNTELKSKGLCFPFPRPTLGPGVHMGTEGTVGKIGFQSVLPDGHWLDDLVGPHFCLVIEATQAHQLTAETAGLLEVLGVKVIRDGGLRSQQWFKDNNLAAVLLRPDRYVFDSLANLSDLPLTLEHLAAWIKP